MKELPKIYDPALVEDKWYSEWTAKNYFHSKPNPDKKPYTIMIPPPNVTGMLTMGHVLNNTLQDILVRKARMEGYETLWLPGTDHAGIATQTAVEKSLRAEGKTRRDFTRDEFLQLVWDWKAKYGGIIIKQLKKLGVSCDWSRERFTLDDGLSKAVREVFVRLYEKGYIYKGTRIVNWCPVSLTALSDEEVIYKEVHGHLWHIRYPLKEDPSQGLTIATTRPETMLGDSAVAVHPKDKRYKKFIGKTLILPVANREIPVIADPYVDMEFGTGALKITPCHDPNDYEIGLKHELPFINIFHPDATLNDTAGPDYEGLDRLHARKKIVTELETLGVLVKVESYVHKVGFSERAGVPIEPRVSEQWFVKMDELAKPALAVVNEGQIKFSPDRWVKTYNHWLENVKDWCISRQLWWGHRIPVFTCLKCGWQNALRDDPDVCPECGSKQIKQDDDVLDTWFSSWLWPFSTLDWPEENDDLKYYYPTDDLVTAPDIIFFWVARMIMAGLEFVGDIPFKNVYYTGLIRDAQGRKMSKSLGNSPDPLDLIDRFGADALRFGIMLIAPQGQDILFDENRIETGRNFMNKLWNASRFVLMNCPVNYSFDSYDPHDPHLQTPDKWILGKLQAVIKSVNSNLKKYRFNDAAKDIYDFTWGYFCDWYIELIKSSLYGNDPVRKESALGTAVFVLRNILKLLHPFAPFITEEIWQSVKRTDEPDIMISTWPKVVKRPGVDKSEEDMQLLMDVITAIRTIRSEMTVPPAKKADVLIHGGTENQRSILTEKSDYIRALAKIDELKIAQKLEKPKLSATAVVENLEIYIPLAGLIDVEKERNRLIKEIDSLKKHLEGVRNKLQNPDFIKKAPDNVVQYEREKEKSMNENLSLLMANLARLDD
ncbi:MAG TPA: valine--tRNA ligase [Candidatus Marinimicrobia bacterium]|nr:valine--tRNA ligase [Candidatus Neomarinimicrobiota bacterium]